MPVLFILNRTEVTQSRMQPTVIVEVHSVQHCIYRFAPGSEFLPYRLAVFNLPEKLSLGGLSQ